MAPPLGRPDVVILGAGPAGIAAAIALGRRAVVLEQRADIGGLGGSLERDGATFDVGGHSFHTPHADVKRLVFDALEMYEQKREARCYSHGSLISYPFQKHFRELEDTAVVAECERGLRDTDGGTDAADFAAYLRRRFGSGIAAHFLLPYNQKFWGGDLTRLSLDWTGQRLPAPHGVRELVETSDGERRPLQDDTIVAYPARGGFGEIVKALARRVRDLRLGTGVARVDPARGRLTTTSGEVFHWERLISTLPIDRLLPLIEHVPSALLQEAAHLEYLSLKLVFVVIGHPVDTEIQRIYAADARIPAHKIVINHNSSEFLRGQPHSGLLGEVSSASEAEFASEHLETRFVDGLVDLGLIKSTDEVVSASALTVRYAYPVPTRDRDTIVARLKEWLEARGIYSIGRFGEWAYINSDEAIHRGLRLGQAIG